MKCFITTFLLLCTVFLGAKAQKASFKIEETLSSIKWKGYAGVGTYAPIGTIKIKNGSITCTAQQIKSGEVSIDMATIKTENKDLESHLKNEDFFDCEKYPTAKFTLTALKGNRAIGQLTIKGITKNIAFPIVYTFQNGKLTIVAMVKVDRTLFNIKYNSASYFQDLGNYAIKNEFDLTINLVAIQI